MNTALWVCEILLGAVFIMAGAFKALAYDKARAQLPWVKEVSRGLTTFIGVSELAGGIGVIAPRAANVVPLLTPLAALGLALVMLLAMGFHARRKEFGAIVFNLVLMALALFVAWGTRGYLGLS